MDSEFDRYLIRHYKTNDSSREIFECSLETLCNNDVNFPATLDEIVKFCKYVLNEPIKDLYSEAKKN